MNELKDISQDVLDGDMNKVKESVQAALNARISASDILHGGLIPAMGEVGRLFEQGEYYVPEMLIAARAMKAGLEIIKPLLVVSGVEPIGKIAIGSVKGDLHDIGKNLVKIMLEGNGFEVIDLGTDVPADKFVQTVKEERPDILALSALLTTTMPSMQEVIVALRNAGLREQVKVIVGGAPVTETYAKQIDADGFSPDASRAVDLAKALLQKAHSVV